VKFVFWDNYFVLAVVLGLKFVLLFLKSFDPFGQI
jgi:hypothetical protein